MKAMSLNGEVRVTLHVIRGEVRATFHVIISLESSAKYDFSYAFKSVFFHHIQTVDDDRLDDD